MDLLTAVQNFVVAVADNRFMRLLILFQLVRLAFLAVDHDIGFELPKNLEDLFHISIDARQDGASLLNERHCRADEVVNAMTLPRQGCQALLDLFVDLVHLLLQHRLLDILEREQNAVVDAGQQVQVAHLLAECLVLAVDLVRRLWYLQVEQLQVLDLA